VTTDETTEAGLQEAFGYYSKLDVARAADDAVAALEYVRDMPEARGKSGVMGFCLGGRLAYEVGVNADPDVVVSYYGSGIAERLEDAPNLRCPVIFQFGGADNFIGPEQAANIEAAFSNHPAAEFHSHPDGGHAFDNFRAPIFYRQPAADAAWPQTREFLERAYPAS
jgi:carboxymethylenebutenolidase